MEVEIYTKTTVVYESWMKLTEAPGGKSMQDKIVMALLRYAFYGETPDFKYGSTEYLLFMQSVQMVEADKRKKKGGAPIGNNNAKKEKTTYKNNLKTTPKQTTITGTLTETLTETNADAPPVGGTPQIEKQGSYLATLTPKNRSHEKGSG